MRVDSASNWPRSYKTRTSGTRNKIKPTLAGSASKMIPRNIFAIVRRICAYSPNSACAESVGKEAIPADCAMARCGIIISVKASATALAEPSPRLRAMMVFATKFSCTTPAPIRRGSINRKTCRTALSFSPAVT